MSTETQPLVLRSSQNQPAALTQPWDEVQWQIATLPSQQIPSNVDSPSAHRRFDAPQAASRPKGLCWTDLRGDFSAEAAAISHCETVDPIAAGGRVSQYRTDHLAPLTNLGSNTGVMNDRAVLAAEERLRERYDLLLAEAAHDVRSPVAAARQIIDSVSRRAAIHRTISDQELGLLRVANQRLAQANNWASGILANHRLANSSGLSAIKRFYPIQWQELMQPLLQFIADEHNVRLLWIDWERSLPKLYLDVNLLSRAVLNVVTNAIQASEVGGQVAIRASWSGEIGQRFVIHVEDQGQGMSRDLLSAINSSGQLLPMDYRSSAFTASSKGLGIATSRRLITEVGGALSAQKLSPQGTSVRVSLPTDELRSLLRGWLMKLQESSKPGEQASPFQVFGLKSNNPHSVAFIDRAIQETATKGDFVYRFARECWFFFSRRDAVALNGLFKGLARDCENVGGEGSLRHMRIATTKPYALSGSLHCADSAPQLPLIAEKLFKYAQPLLEKAIPAIDNLQDDFGDSYANIAAHYRPEQKVANRIDRGHVAGRPYLNGISESEASPASAFRNDAEFGQALKTMADSWKSTQQRLNQAHSVAGHPIPAPKAAKSRTPTARPN
ncbi:MAG: sensor histidine kinase [Planctomycetota bacterium]